MQYPLGSRDNPGDQSVLRENLHILVSNVPTSTNNFGLCEVQDRSLAKSENVLRIAVFGDSFTFGWGVRDDETFPYQLEKLLDDRLSDKCKVEVLNFGIPGFNTLQEFIYFSRFGMRFFPDVVLFQWFANDFETDGYKLTDLDTVKRGKLLDRRDRPQSPKSDFGILTQFLTWLKKNSNLYEMAAPKVKNLLFNYFGMHVDADDYYYTSFETVGARLSIAALIEAAQFAKGKNIQFEVIIYPFMSALKTDFYQEKIYGKLESILSSHDIRIINLFPEVFAGRDYQDMIASNRDHHPNKLAHGLAAKAITNWLMDEYGLVVQCPVINDASTAP